MKLYEQSSRSFPSECRRVVVDGSKGMHALDSMEYWIRKLHRRPIEWIVMADEDVFFAAPAQIYRIIEFMAGNGYAVCGVRDGGVISHRVQNPHVINSFFAIIKASELFESWEVSEVRQHQRIDPGEFCDDLSSLSYSYDVDSLYEPYYCVYLWMRRRHKKFLFLNSVHPFSDDSITNAVLDLNGDILLYHTWYARAYGINMQHTHRINRVASMCDLTSPYDEPEILRSRFFGYQKHLRRMYAGIRYKLFGMS